MEYSKRFLDKTLAERLQSSGVVLIEGIKGCGKTETAKQAASWLFRAMQTICLQKEGHSFPKSSPCILCEEDHKSLLCMCKVQ